MTRLKSTSGETREKRRRKKSLNAAIYEYNNLLCGIIEVGGEAHGAVQI